MLNTIYETGYDLHVANYVAYLHTDKKLYEDEAHKTSAKKADVEKAFKLGRLMVVDCGPDGCRCGCDRRHHPHHLHHGCGRGLIFSGSKVSHNKSKWSEKR